MAAAAVVAANPVIAPRADLQIRPVDLSTIPGGMLDEGFLAALDPAPSGATGPIAVFKDLVSSLVADAAYLGGAGLTTTAVAEAPDLSALADLAGIRPADPGAPYSPPAYPSPAVAQALTAIAGNARDTSGAPAAFPETVFADPPVSAPQTLSLAAHDFLSVELPRTLDNFASVVAGVPLAPPVIADSITALGRQLAALPVPGSMLASALAGDSSDPASGSTLPVGRPGPSPRSSAGGEGTGTSGGATKPVGQRIFPLHRPGRPGSGKPGLKSPRQRNFGR